MSHTLTEADTFTPTITVPDGTDPGSGRSEDVTAIAQGLADRTKRLNLHAAKFDEVQTWTQGQLFAILAAGTAMLKSTKAANEDTSNPTNIWKEQFAFKLNDGGQWCRFYSGTGNLSFGNWCITTNAKWNEAPSPSPGQTWSKDNDTYESNVLRCFNGELHWYGKGPGAGVWNPASWDTTRGNLLVGDTIFTDELHAFSTVRADTDITAGGSYNYNTPPTRTVIVPLFDSFGEGTISFAGGTFHLEFSAGSKVHAWPLHLPDGGTFVSAQLVCAKAGSGSATLRLYKKSGFDWGSPPGSMPTDTELAAASSTASGNVRLAISVSESVNSDVEDLYLHFTSGDADAVYGLRLSFVDPGPRNY